MPRPLSPSRMLLRWLDESSSPVYALDSQQRILFANQALGQWLGVAPNELLGLKCEYGIVDNGPLAPLGASLCPPPEALIGVRHEGFVCRPAKSFSNSDATGEVQPAGNPSSGQRRVRFVRLAGSEPDNGLLLVVVSPEESSDSNGDRPLESERLHAILVELYSKLGKRFHTSQLLGESDTMRRVREQVRVAAKTRARVLVVGPEGSGREHVARTIHYAEPAAAIGTLVPIDCGLVDAEQMQAALATLLRRQQKEPSERPPVALLLDADQLRPDAQQELAGFLSLPNVELHTLATSTKGLLGLAKRGKFRIDLALALSTLTIHLPPLKDRMEDVPLLAQHFLEAANLGREQQLSGFHPAAMELLAAHAWPGNVDELARAVGDASQRARGPEVQPADLPDWVHLAQSAASRKSRDDEAIRLDEFLAEVERELMQRALVKARGNKSRAAQLLGINRARLLRRLSQLGLTPAVPIDEESAAEEPVIFEPLDGS